MIHFNEHVLKNGLRLIVNEDPTTPMAVVNILYDVGSRDEQEDKTGFAHLFEHLMFGGSKNIPSFDHELEKVGGSSNAFTSPDVTNYYIKLPIVNLETAFWLESDRMMNLLINEKSLEVQRKVVVEEFKQRYLNQPYGDVWMHLRSLAYKVHPYRWQTIGRDISHIEKATLEDVRDFFQKYYLPNNAIMVVVGNTRFSDVVTLVEKWFGEIPSGTIPTRNLPQEPPQTAARHLEVEANVPVSVIYKLYHTVPKNHPDYYAISILSSLLGESKSSRLYERLVKKEKIFTDISAFCDNSFDTGLLTISGKLSDGVSLQEADEAITHVISELQNQVPPQERELQKIKNQTETTFELGEMYALHRAIRLAYAALLGDTHLVNQEKELFQKVTLEKIHQLAHSLLQKERCSTLYYKAVPK